MEVADCPTPDNALVGSRTPIVKKPEEDYHQTQEESPPVSPRSRENVYQLSQVRGGGLGFVLYVQNLLFRAQQMLLPTALY